jgi:hypothetical protein
MTDQIPARFAGGSSPRPQHFSDFCRLWLGQNVWALGSQVTALALSVTVRSCTGKRRQPRSPCSPPRVSSRSPA